MKNFNFTLLVVMTVSLLSGCSQEHVSLKKAPGSEHLYLTDNGASYYLISVEGEVRAVKPDSTCLHEHWIASRLASNGHSIENYVYANGICHKKRDAGAFVETTTY